MSFNSTRSSVGVPFFCWPVLPMEWRSRLPSFGPRFSPPGRGGCACCCSAAGSRRYAWLQAPDFSCPAFQAARFRPDGSRQRVVPALSFGVRAWETLGSAAVFAERASAGRGSGGRSGFSPPAHLGSVAARGSAVSRRGFTLRFVDRGVCVPRLGQPPP